MLLFLTIGFVTPSLSNFCQKNLFFLFFWNGVDLPPSYLDNVCKYTVCFFWRHPLMSPLHSPTLIKKSKISSQVEISSWAWVWQHPRHYQKLSNNLKTPSQHNTDTFQISYILHTPFRHLSVIHATATDSFHTPKGCCLQNFSNLLGRRSKGL